MTKEEMLNSVTQLNYDSVQEKIKAAMMQGKNEETFRMVGMSPLQGWEILSETIELLKNDGFIVEEVDNKYGYFDGLIKVSW